MIVQPGAECIEDRLALRRPARRTLLRRDVAQLALCQKEPITEVEPRCRHGSLPLSVGRREQAERLVELAASMRTAAGQGDAEQAVVTGEPVDVQKAAEPL